MDAVRRACRWSVRIGLDCVASALVPCWPSQSAWVARSIGCCCKLGPPQMARASFQVATTRRPSISISLPLFPACSPPASSNHRHSTVWASLICLNPSPGFLHGAHLTARPAPVIIPSTTPATPLQELVHSVHSSRLKQITSRHYPFPDTCQAGLSDQPFPHSLHRYRWIATFRSSLSRHRFPRP